MGSLKHCIKKKQIWLKIYKYIVNYYILTFFYMVRQILYFFFIIKLYMSCHHMLKKNLLNITKLYSKRLNSPKCIA